MANKVLLKKSSVGAKVPQTTDLDFGELAINYADGKLYFKNSSNTIDYFPANSLLNLEGGFSGDYNDLTNKPTIPNDLDDITTNGAITSNSIEIGGLTVGELVYPTTDGTTGQVLATDGNGNLSFVDQSAGGSSGEVVTFNIISRSGEVGAKLTGLIQQYINFDNLTFRNPTGVVETRTATVTVLG